MHRDAQVEGLRPAPTAVAAGKRLADAPQHRPVFPDRPPEHQVAGLLEGTGNGFAARHLAQPGLPMAVGQDDDVAGEDRRMRPAQVEQHAVLSGHRHDPHAGNGWCRMSHRNILSCQTRGRPMAEAQPTAA